MPKDAIVVILSTFMKFLFFLTLSSVITLFAQKYQIFLKNKFKEKIQITESGKKVEPWIVPRRSQSTLF